MQSPSTSLPLHQEPHIFAGPDALMDPRTTADYLGVAVLSLADWRTKGAGPDYIKVGASVRYRRSALEAWLESRTKKGA